MPQNYINFSIFQFCPIFSILVLFTACDFNVHKRCKNLVSNNCGINARQLADILNDMGMTPHKLNESAKPNKKKGGSEPRPPAAISSTATTTTTTLPESEDLNKDIEEQVKSYLDYSSPGWKFLIPQFFLGKIATSNPSTRGHERKAKGASARCHWR